MRIIAQYDEQRHPPLLRFSIHDAPHRRMHIECIRQYRHALRFACMRAMIDFPIDHPIDLAVTFVNPSSPDLDNLLTALYQAMDGKTLNGPGILTDDGLISHVSMGTLWIGQRERVTPQSRPKYPQIVKQAVA